MMPLRYFKETFLCTLTLILSAYANPEIMMVQKLEKVIVVSMNCNVLWSPCIKL